MDCTSAEKLKSRVSAVNSSADIELMSTAMLKSLVVPTASLGALVTAKQFARCEQLHKSWRVEEDRVEQIVAFATQVCQMNYKQGQSSGWLESVAGSLRGSGWQQLVNMKSPLCQLWKMDKRLDDILSLAKKTSHVASNLQRHIPEQTTCTLIVLPKTAVSGVCRMFQDYVYRQEWDDKTSKIEVLEDRGNGEALLRYETIFPWPLKPREYLIATCKRSFSLCGLRCHVLYQRTVDPAYFTHASRPGFVRAPYYEQVYILRQHGDDAQIVQMFCHNAGVHLPRWLEDNAVRKDFPAFIRHTLSALEKFLSEKCASHDSISD